MPARRARPRLRAGFAVSSGVVKRRLPILAMMMLVFAPAAQALDFPSAPLLDGLDVGVAAGPVFAPDGGLVAAVQSGPVANVWRLALGRFPGLITAVAVPEAGPEQHYLRIALVRAGDGFFLTHGVGYHGGAVGGFEFTDHPVVTWFPQPGALGTDVPICTTVRCAHCTGLGMTVLPDDSHVALIPDCAGVFKEILAQPVVRDLSTGEDTPLPSGSASHLAGRFVSSVGSDGSLTVADWRSGEVVTQTGPGNQYVHALVEDGSLLYADRSSLVQRWAPGATAWEPTAMTGEPVAVAGGRLLTREPYGRGLLRVWSLDGALLDTLDTLATVGDFDGRRVGLRMTSCLTTRITVWDVGGAEPEPDLPFDCGVPGIVPPAHIGSAIRLRLRCPPAVAQGCAGAALTRPPVSGDPPPPVNFRLRPGAERVVTVASHLRPAACRRVARQKRLRVWITISQGRQPHVALVTELRVARVARCR